VATVQVGRHDKRDRVLVVLQFAFLNFNACDLALPT
jgi:hypothetical protein